MELVLSGVLYLLAIAIVAQMAVQGIKGKVELLSLRNFFFVGLLIYQVLNAARMLGSQRSFPFYPLQDMGGTGVKYVLTLLLFLVIFNFVYMRGNRQRVLAMSTKSTVLQAGVVSMLTLLTLFVITGLILRNTWQYMGQLGYLVDLMGLGLLAVAAGMAGWVWMSNFWNIIAGTICLAAFGAALQSEIGTFGRRDLVGIAAAFLFGAYHGSWKHRGPWFSILCIAASGSIGFVLLAAHTAVRVAFQQQQSLSRVIERLIGADVGTGLTDVTSGQDAAAVSFWLIESRTMSLPYDFLHSLRVFSTFSIPRFMWPDKPIALAFTVPKQAGVTKVAEDFNVGPGLVGHIWNDNPYVALVLYAILLALAFRWLDNLIRKNPNNPFVVLPVGAALGQFLGLARGELGAFAFRAVIYMITAWATVQVLYRIFAAVGLRMTVESVKRAEPEDPESETVDDPMVHDPTVEEAYSQPQPSPTDAPPPARGG